MNYQRLAIGLIACVFLIIGSFRYFTQIRPIDDDIWTGIFVRVGLLMAVIWLAMPQLETLQTKISTIMFLVLLLILVVVATRPKLFPVVSGILAVSLALNWGLKWVSQFTQPPKR